jgi:pimeloyl-ACP methyl ester carboxylesterase
MAADNATTYTRGWCGTGEITFLTLSSGTRLRYLKVGTGPLLLLLHTLRTQLDYFQRLIPKLTSHFTVYAVDLPGLGWSDILPGASYEEPAVRTAVVEFVEKLDLKDLTLAGESIGATLSLSTSTQLDRRVRNIIALNTYDYPEGVERANLLASLAVKAMRIPVLGLLPSKLENALILRGVMRGGFFDPSKFPEGFLAEQLRSGRRSGYAQVECGYFRALPSYVAARNLYSRINVPVTLIYGDHDWSKPHERDEVAQLVQGSRRITLTQSGHFGSLEHPDEIANIVIEGLRSPVAG